MNENNDNKKCLNINKGLWENHASYVIGHISTKEPNHINQLFSIRNAGRHNWEHDFNFLEDGKVRQQAQAFAMFSSTSH